MDSEFAVADDSFEAEWVERKIDKAEAARQLEVRRRIEALQEEKRMRRELGELD